jgi:hypothetical protein
LALRRLDLREEGIGLGKIAGVDSLLRVGLQRDDLGVIAGLS